MAKLHSASVLMGLLAAGCAGSLRVDSAVMPQGSFVATSDVDIDALYEASQALGVNSTRPPTVQGLARALADLEYVSGAFNTRARWIGIDGEATAGMLVARRETRNALGIPQDAPSQSVVNGLMAASRADSAQTMQAALADPIFTLGPQATEERLRNFPSLFSTPYAIARLNRAISEPRGGSCQRIGC
jgi:GH24 family phage-related lysozyme (muramidase)